nr:2'-5' RNA ligase family protein [uncultured Chryseobacterium sp.]
MIEHYSIVIHPQDQVVELFRSLKNQLKKKVGSFASCHSAAHITILEFEGNEEQLKYTIEKLTRIARREVSFDTVFNKIVSSEQSKCIFALPDKNGKEHFRTLFSRIRKEIKGNGKKSNAHLSIGRELKAEQLKKSRKLFSDLKFDFYCDTIAIRKFNKNIKQFEIIKVLSLSGKHPVKRYQQLSFDF